MAELASRTLLAVSSRPLGPDPRTFPPVRLHRFARGSAPPREPDRQLPGAQSDCADASPARLHIALLALSRARSTREVVDALLSHANQLGRRGALFLRAHGELRGWAGCGRGVSVTSLASARLRLDHPSVLAYLTRAPTSYRGRIHHDTRSRDFLIAALTSVPDDITAFSISAGSRVVGVAYADGTAGRIRGNELARLGFAAGSALARIHDRPAPAGSHDRDDRISH